MHRCAEIWRGTILGGERLNGWRTQMEPKCVWQTYHLHFTPRNTHGPRNLGTRNSSAIYLRLHWRPHPILSFFSLPASQNTLTINELVGGVNPRCPGRSFKERGSFRGEHIPIIVHPRNPRIQLVSPAIHNLYSFLDFLLTSLIADPLLCRTRSLSQRSNQSRRNYLVKPKRNSSGVSLVSSGSSVDDTG